jgi:hypothetical protein
MLIDFTTAAAVFGRKVSGFVVSVAKPPSQVHAQTEGEITQNPKLQP